MACATAAVQYTLSQTLDPDPWSLILISCSSVCRGILILWVRHCEEILELPLQSLKGWPFHCILQCKVYQTLIMFWANQDIQKKLISLSICPPPFKPNIITVEVSSYLVPAFEHDVVQRRRTILGARHPVAMLHLVKNLCICHPCKAQTSLNLLPHSSAVLFTSETLLHHIELDFGYFKNKNFNRSS